jgi:hypothetical protein
MQLCLERRVSAAMVVAAMVVAAMVVDTLQGTRR